VGQERRKIVPRQKITYSPEFREEAVKMVLETSRPAAHVARELGIKENTLYVWLNAYRKEHQGEEPPLNTSERARLRELERENKELKMKAEFLGKAAAFFAQEYR
jgi:transposase-like protein